VLVTHNKGSMAACDALYGITMQVRGVSHHVSVELDQVDEFLPDARGGGPAESNGAEHGAENGAENGSEAVVELVPHERARADALGEPSEAREGEELTRAN
jgi:hypothetical protein